MLVNYSELFKKGFGELTLLFGEEEFLLDDAFLKVLNHLSPERTADYNFDLFDGNDCQLSQVLDIASSFPMMADHRVVAVKNFHKFFKAPKPKADNYKSLVKYLTNPSPSTKLILHSADKKLFGTNKAMRSIRKPEELAKKLKAKAFPNNLLLSNYNCVEFEKIWPDKYPNYLMSKMSEKGKNISSQAVNQLIAHSPESLRYLSNELEKLDIYTAERRQIELEDVNEISGQNKDFNVFELQEAVSVKDLSKSLLIMENMLKNNRLEVFIISMLTNHFKTIWKAVEAVRIANDKYSLARELGVSPFFVDKYKKALNYYSSSQIENIFIYLCDADEKLKTSSGSEMFIMQELILKIIRDK